MKSICKLENIEKSFSNKVILKDLNLEIEKGEMVSIIGNSGAGKTTILNIMGLLEKPDKGRIQLFDKDVTNISKNALNLILREKLSYLFQNFALIDNESIDKNLDVALLYSNKNKLEKLNMKQEALKEVGLNIPLNTKIYSLSGGEQQRVAIARILLKPCELIIADEPTGSLDTYNRDEILNILKKLNKDGKTIIIVTHDSYIANKCDRIFKIKDGKVEQIKNCK